MLSVYLNSYLVRSCKHAYNAHVHTRTHLNARFQTLRYYILVHECDCAPGSTLTVCGVTPGEAADVAGIQEGDRIISVQGERIDSVVQVRVRIRVMFYRLNIIGTGSMSSWNTLFRGKMTILRNTVCDFRFVASASRTCRAPWRRFYGCHCEARHRCIDFPYKRVSMNALFFPKARQCMKSSEVRWRRKPAIDAATRCCMLLRGGEWESRF